MKNMLKITLVSGAVLLVGGLAVVLTQDQQSEELPNPTLTIESTPRTDSQTPAQNDNQRLGYIQTSSDEIDTVDTEKRVLFFHASWCSTCRLLSQDIESNAALIPENLTIMNVDFDDETDLRRKYGVRIQHTLVQIDENGDEIAKWSGSPDLAAVLSRVQ
jgi:thioredoxin 1